METRFTPDNHFGIVTLLFNGNHYAVLNMFLDKCEFFIYVEKVRVIYSVALLVIHVY